MTQFTHTQFRISENILAFALHVLSKLLSIIIIIIIIIQFLRRVITIVPSIRVLRHSKLNGIRLQQAIIRHFDGILVYILVLVCFQNEAQKLVDCDKFGAN